MGAADGGAPDGGGRSRWICRRWTKTDGTERPSRTQRTTCDFCDVLGEVSQRAHRMVAHCVAAVAAQRVGFGKDPRPRINVAVNAQLPPARDLPATAERHHVTLARHLEGQLFRERFEGHQPRPRAERWRCAIGGKTTGQVRRGGEVTQGRGRNLQPRCAHFHPGAATRSAASP